MPAQERLLQKSNTDKKKIKITCNPAPHPPALSRVDLDVTFPVSLTSPHLVAFKSHLPQFTGGLGTSVFLFRKYSYLLTKLSSTFLLVLICLARREAGPPISGPEDKRAGAMGTFKVTKSQVKGKLPWLENRPMLQHAETRSAQIHPGSVWTPAPVTQSWKSNQSQERVCSLLLEPIRHLDKTFSCLHSVPPPSVWTALLTFLKAGGSCPCSASTQPHVCFQWLWWTLDCALGLTPPIPVVSAQLAPVLVVICTSSYLCSSRGVLPRLLGEGQGLVYVLTCSESLCSKWMGPVGVLLTPLLFQLGALLSFPYATVEAEGVFVCQCGLRAPPFTLPSNTFHPSPVLRTLVLETRAWCDRLEI